MFYIYVNFNFFCNRSVVLIFGGMRGLNNGLKEAHLTSINLV